MIVMFAFHEEVQWIVSSTLVFCQRHSLTETLKPEQALELIRCMIDDGVSEMLNWAPISETYHRTAEKYLPWYRPGEDHELSNSYWSLVMDRVFAQTRQAVSAIYKAKTWDVVAVTALRDETVVIEKVGDWRVLQYEQLQAENRILPEGWKCRFINGNPVIVHIGAPEVELGSLVEDDPHLHLPTSGYDN